MLLFINRLYIINNKKLPAGYDKFFRSHIQLAFLRRLWLVEVWY